MATDSMVPPGESPEPFHEEVHDPRRRDFINIAAVSFAGVGALAMKPLAPWIVRTLGFRRVLLANAIRFTGDGGRIRIAAQAGILGGTRVARVDIEDTGAGIAAEDLPHIFDRFYRTDNARTHTKKGTGLGLSISYDIVTQQHGGTISASNNPNGGACIEIRLPEGIQTPA